MVRQPLVMERCSSQLWDGVECELPAGHKGPHHRGASPDGAALSWRSSVAIPVPPVETQPAMFQLATLAR